MSSKPCLKTLPCRILQTPSAGHCSDTRGKLGVKDRRVIRNPRLMKTYDTRFSAAHFGKKHPSCDVIFSGQNVARKKPKIITSHNVLETLKQALLASRDVIISGQICGSKLLAVFTLGDGRWLPNAVVLLSLAKAALCEF